MRERGGEAVLGGDGARTYQKDSTRPSLRLDAARTTEKLSDELSETLRAGKHVLPSIRLPEQTTRE